MQDAVFGFNEWTLTTASWVFYFLALLSYIGLLVAQAAQVSQRRVVAREALDFGGVQPAFATAVATGGGPRPGPRRWRYGAARRPRRCAAPRAPLAAGVRRLTIAGWLSLTSALVMRANTSGHIPYMSLYEICLMLTFGISLAYLLIGEIWLKTRSVGAFALLFVYLIEVLRAVAHSAGPENRQAAGARAAVRAGCRSTFRWPSSPIAASPWPPARPLCTCSSTTRSAPGRGRSLRRPRPTSSCSAPSPSASPSRRCC